MGLVELTMENYKEEVQQSDKPVLIDFYAEWCGPCQMMAPVIHELAVEMDNIKFVKCNVDEVPGLAMQFNVQSIPTLVGIKEGKVVMESVGFLPKEEIKGKIVSSL